MSNPLGVCSMYDYIDWTLYYLNDNSWPDISDWLYDNVFEC
jgi:hypothetical protein